MVFFYPVRPLAADSVATTDIQDDAISLAKLSAGTDGNLITFDASGDPAAVATGTAGQVLTSNGAGAAPTMQAAAAGYPDASSTGQVYWEDFFIIPDTTTGWTFNGATVTGAAQSLMHIIFGASADNEVHFTQPTVALSATEQTIEFRFQTDMEDNGDTNTGWGVGDAVDFINAAGNGIFLTSNTGDANGNWVTEAATVQTTTAEADAKQSGDGMHTIAYVGTTSTIEFFLDTVSQGSHSTNIPTADMMFGICMTCDADTCTFDLDYVHIHGSARTT